MITLATLPQATAQEVFEQVANHLIKQNAKSIDTLNKEKLCVYLDKSTGNKCAAGCLIADSEYNYHFENNTWYHLIVNYKIPNNHAELITRLQRIHDKYEPHEFKEKLILLGIKEKLNTTFLTNP